MATVKGTWWFNNVLSKPTWIEQEVNFTCTILDKDRNAVRFVYDSQYDNTVNASGFAVRFDGWTQGIYGFANGAWYGVSTPFEVNFGAAEQEVSAEFYTWFTANATRIDEEETPIATITYKGEILETLNSGEYVTLHTKGKKMEDDIRVEVAEVSGGDIAINGIVEQYKVNAGATVNAGDFVEFVNKFSGGTFYRSYVYGLDACKLDNNRVLVVYRDGFVDSKAVVLLFDDIGVTFSNTVLFEENTEGRHTVSALTGNKVVVSYTKYTDSTRCVYARVIEIDDKTITVGDSVAIEGTLPCVTAITENKALMVYRGHNGNGKYIAYAATLNINGTTISAKTKMLSATTNTLTPVVAKITESKAIVACCNEDGHVYGYILSLAGNGFTVGNSWGSDIASTGNNAGSVLDFSVLSEDRVLLSYLGNGGRIKVTLLGIDEQDIVSLASGSVYPANLSHHTYITPLNNNKVLLTCFEESRTTISATVITITDNDTIIVGTPVEFDSSAYNGENFPTVAFSPTSALVFYNNGAGMYLNLSIDGDTITVGGDGTGTYVQPATSRLHNVGVAKTSGTEGQMVDVYCVGGESV